MRPDEPVLTMSQVVALVDEIYPRYRALILLAVFGSFRRGELAALRRRDIDVDSGAVRIERSLTELPGGGYLFGPPKSAAGRRVVVIPAAIKPELTKHLAAFTAPADDALVFTSPTGAPLLRPAVEVRLQRGRLHRRIQRHRETLPLPRQQHPGPMDPGTSSRHQRLTSGQDTRSARCAERRTPGAGGHLRETDRWQHQHRACGSTSPRRSAKNSGLTELPQQLRGGCRRLLRRRARLRWYSRLSVCVQPPRRSQRRAAPWVQVDPADLSHHRIWEALQLGAALRCNESGSRGASRASPGEFPAARRRSW
jgi:hypothetical protein